MSARRAYGRALDRAARDPRTRRAVECDGPDCGNCRAKKADQEWFRANPGSDEYFRPPFPGELMDAPGVAMVRVVQIRPGVRVKEAVCAASMN